MTRPKPLPPRRPRQIFDGQHAGVSRDPDLPPPSNRAVAGCLIAFLLVAAVIAGLFLWGHSREHDPWNAPASATWSSTAG
jgi:hypothetical protein